jgi:chemotaxis protein CheD
MAPSPERRIHIIQGEQQVADDPAIMLTTILGSCVAACLRDPVAGIGGMNHFLLPGDKPDSQTSSRGENAMRYGVHAMELLVNGLLRSGAQRHRIEAKLFGGARMMKGLTDVGELNATFAEKFLKDEKIVIVGGSLRGTSGRRIQFWPVSGRARQVVLGADQDAVFNAERRLPAPITRPGALELF